MADTIVVPGDKLDPSLVVASASNGACVYKKEGGHYASLCARITSQGTIEPLFTPVVIPEKKSIVLCKVISVGQAFAKVNIISVHSTVLREPLQAVIRREEVRATEKDRICLFNSFRPRDIVRARVLTLGEAHYYTLTTAENELGVVLARSSPGGYSMVPVSWCEMQCTVTGVREKRKVAKVIDNVSL